MVQIPGFSNDDHPQDRMLSPTQLAQLQIYLQQLAQHGNAERAWNAHTGQKTRKNRRYEPGAVLDRGQNQAMKNALLVTKAFENAGLIPAIPRVNILTRGKWLEKGMVPMIADKEAVMVYNGNHRLPPMFHISQVMAITPQQQAAAKLGLTDAEYAAYMNSRAAPVAAPAAVQAAPVVPFAPTDAQIQAYLDRQAATKAAADAAAEAAYGSEYKPLPVAEGQANA